MTASVRAVLAIAALGAAIGGCAQLPPAEAPVATVPEPRNIEGVERAELAKLVRARTGASLPPDAETRAAGSFRFAGSRDFLYMDRLDTGSVAFENHRYGATGVALDPQSVDESALLRRIENRLAALALDPEGKQFSGFQDEYAGAGRPADMGPGFDPRKASKHVARTATFRRVSGGIPVFGSELVVGLMPDGSLGRLRMHWPAVAPDTLKRARELEDIVATGAWELPDAFRGKTIEVLDVQAGVKHAGFAVPGTREAAVVRVLVRKSAGEERLRTSSTRYVYLDGTGRELRFAAFPVLPGTASERKAAVKDAGVECGEHAGQKAGGLSISPCPNDPPAAR